MHLVLLLSVIGVLFLMIYNGKTTKALDMDELLNGRMPAQREGLEPYFEEIVFPQEMEPKDVILGINTKPVQQDGSVNWQISHFLLSSTCPIHDGIAVYLKSNCQSNESVVQ